jgi:hypothetical protein
MVVFVFNEPEMFMTHEVGFKSESTIETRKRSKSLNSIPAMVMPIGVVHQPGLILLRQLHAGHTSTTWAITKIF